MDCSSYQARVPRLRFLRVGLFPLVRILATKNPLHRSPVSPRVEVQVLDGQIPMRIEDFEAPLLFLLVGFLVGIKLLD